MIPSIVALVLAALLLCYPKMEIDGSALFQLGICVTICALLPTARKVRRLLASKNKKQIEEHFQRILALFCTSLLSVCFVIFQAVGCLSRDDDDIAQTCKADSMSSYTIAQSIVLIFIYEVFFNFIDVEVSMESKCTLRGTSFLTFAQTFVYGVSSFLAFAVYGMKQFVFKSMDPALVEDEDGISNEQIY